VDGGNNKLPDAHLMHSFRFLNAQVVLTPTAADGNFVTDLWATSTDIYTSLQACPTTASTFDSSSATAATAIKGAVNQAIYGVQVAGADVDGVTIGTDGKLTLTRTTGSGSWAYVITAVSLNVACCHRCSWSAACSCPHLLTYLTL
jgi:hypothetical protein